MNVSKFLNHCCGCGECYAICPTKAIMMQPNKQGFLYPVVDEKKCVECSKCVSHCSFNKTAVSSNSVKIAYAMKHIDEEVRAQSRSGGIFTALSDFVLEQGGVVYGCVLKNNRDAVHVRATTVKERNLMRGSKYIQSRTHDVFESIRKDVRQGSWVLFSGTSCQVNAVKDFCKDEKCEKLLLVDIVCYGVPSSMVWKDYLDYLEKKENNKIDFVNFRNKKVFGWAAHKETIYFRGGKTENKDIYARLFFSKNILRKDCFFCPYKNLHRVGDISIADCWGITKEYPAFDDNKGVSLVLVNTEKGKNIYSKLDVVKDISVDINKLIQPALKENWKVPQEYDEFWKYYQKHSFNKVIDKFVYKKPSLISRVKNKIFNILYRLYRKIFKRK